MSPRLKYTLEILGLILVIGASVWTLVESRGDNRWAQKAKTQAVISEHSTEIAILQSQAQSQSLQIDRRFERIEEGLTDLQEEVKESRRDNEQMFRQILEKF